MKLKNLYPTLCQSVNFPSYSWYRNSKQTNPNYKKTKSKIINSSYTDTYIITLQLTDLQKKIIDKWLDSCIDIYNLTNEYIKKCIENKKITSKNFKNEVDFYKIRSILSKDIDLIRNKSFLNKHTAVEALHHCVSMYKSAFSNIGNLDKFNIKNLDHNRKRKNLVIEPSSISKNKNSFFVSVLGDDIKSSEPLKIIKRSSILQYNERTDTYKIIVPIDKEFKKLIERDKKCGIDIGVRTFATVYSESATYELGIYPEYMIDKYNRRLDNIRRAKDEGFIDKYKYENLMEKYSAKLKNKINDMHSKLACFLLNRFDTIVIGKVSIKSMISNLTGNIRKITKRRLIALSHYTFRQKLKSMAKKYKAKIIEVDEYLTSKTCCICGTINDVKGSKTYECKKCKLKIDRDINASINIYEKK